MIGLVLILTCKRRSRLLQGAIEVGFNIDCTVLQLTIPKVTLVYYKFQFEITVHSLPNQPQLK